MFKSNWGVWWNVSWMKEHLPFLEDFVVVFLFVCLFYTCFFRGSVVVHIFTHFFFPKTTWYTELNYWNINFTVLCIFTIITNCTKTCDPDISASGKNTVACCKADRHYIRRERHRNVKLDKCKIIVMADSVICLVGDNVTSG